MSEDVNPQPGDRKTKPLVYVAGPYTNPDPISNTRTAIEVGMALYDYENVAVLIPHLTMLAHFLEPRLVDDWYRFDLDQLAHCDAVFRIPGESTGADAEIAAAMQMGQPVFNEVAELRAWLVERATPPAPENPYRWAARYWKRHQAWDEGFEACRLAGLQAPPVDDTDMTESDFDRRMAASVPANPWVVRGQNSSSDPEGSQTINVPTPVDDVPVGWANRYVSGWTAPQPTYLKALDQAEDLGQWAGESECEVAVPLYRRPGVQTPAAEPLGYLLVGSDLQMQNSWPRRRSIHHRYLVTKERAVESEKGYPGWIPCAVVPLDSAGVQSPPATPELEGLTGLLDKNGKPLYVVWRPDERWIWCGSKVPGAYKVLGVPVPVPDPETETTDG